MKMTWKIKLMPVRPLPSESHLFWYRILFLKKQKQKPVECIDSHLKESCSI